MKHPHVQAKVEDYSTIIPREGLGSEKEKQVGLGVQKLIYRKRLRPNDDERSETISFANSMEIDEHLKNFFSESESDESDMYFGSEL